ncbi:unnamed protein product, partial [Toxocara canis]|uniref:ABC transmembrane type-1 domain-containing protein n=1 Tax=Toxocara canis TaxID=6265 RepID=A0A183TY80_TOXCA
SRSKSNWCSTEFLILRDAQFHKKLSSYGSEFLASAFQISLDGVSLDRLNVSWLRHTIGIIQSEPVIFDGSIEQNIRLGDPNMSDDQMRILCRNANAHNFILDLPEGYNTQVGEGGMKLSIDQKVRIAIARSMARNPKVLIIDQTAAVAYGQNEGVVNEALKRVPQPEDAKQFLSVPRSESVSNTDKWRWRLVRSLMSMPSSEKELEELKSISQPSREAMLSGARLDAVYFTLLGIFAAAFTFAGCFLFGWTSESLTARLRLQFFVHVLKQDGGYFDSPEHTPEKLIAYLSNDVPKIRVGVDRNLNTKDPTFLVLFNFFRLLVMNKLKKSFTAFC